MLRYIFTMPMSGDPRQRICRQGVCDEIFWVPQVVGASGCGGQHLPQGYAPRFGGV
jgi:hypothetical protein